MSLNCRITNKNCGRNSVYIYTHIKMSSQEKDETLQKCNKFFQSKLCKYKLTSSLGSLNFNHINFLFMFLSGFTFLIDMLT